MIEMDRLGELLDSLSGVESGDRHLLTDMRAQYCYLAEYAIGERVHVDGDTSITFVIVELYWRGEGTVYQLSWFANGVKYAEYFSEWRLTRVESSGGAEPPRQQTAASEEQAPIIGFTGSRSTYK